jgi:hypothetical protein
MSKVHTELKLPHKILDLIARLSNFGATISWN